MTKKYFLFVFLVLLVMILINGIGRRSDTYILSDIVQDDKLNATALRARLVADFEQDKDPAEIYTRIKTVFADEPSRIAHDAAHLFGELLFTYEGMAGLSVCDASLAYGCFHSFFAQAIAAQGVESVVALDAECVKQFGSAATSCMHGIGHGLGEYFGTSRIEEQLKHCEELTWQGTLFGCSEGVFMEYHFQLTEEDRVSYAPSPAKKDVYNPCDRLSGKYLPACYFSLPSWWANVFQDDMKIIDTLCNSVAVQRHKEFCYLGAGYGMSVSADFNADTLKQRCDGLTGANGALLCRAGASYAFFVNEIDPGNTALLCEDIADRQLECAARAKLFDL